MPYRTGGTTAPDRLGRIKQAMRRPKRPVASLNTIAPAGAYKNQSTSPNRNMGVGDSYQPGLGKQLSNRVESGRISQGRAQQTSKERQTLKAAFGSDWRTQVFGKGGARGLEGQSFGRPEIAARRAKALQRARAKLKEPGMAA